MAARQKSIMFPANILGVLGLLSVNIYLPALPSLIHYFQATPADIKLSISLFLLGFAASQFIWGSLSERLGRKKPILGGLLLACVGTVITMIAPNVFLFNTGRLIEGFGIGCASVLTRALLTDSYDKMGLSIAMSYLVTATNVMPALAPIIGGYLLNWFGWRYIFLFLLIYTLSLLIIFYKKVPETHKKIRPDFGFMAAIIDYWHVIKNRSFIGYLLPYVLLSGGMVGYYAAAPFIFITVLHFTSQHYGFTQIATVISYIIGANFSRYATRQIGMEKTIVVGTLIGLVSALSCFISWLFFPLNIFTILVPVMLYCLAAGLVASNANAGAMAALRSKAGSVGAMIGAITYGVSALFSAVIANQNLVTLKPLTIYISLITIAAFVGFVALIILRPVEKNYN